MEDTDYPSFNFKLKYAGQLFDCKVVMGESCYDVEFNNEWKASLAYTEDFNWLQESGVILPQETVDEIGFQIEHTYK